MRVTLELRADDIEPFLREAAYNAAKFSALVDHMTRRTAFAPWRSGETFDEARARWNGEFLKAKRIVESFGVEYEPTSEAETLTVYVPMKVLKSHLVKAAGVTFRHIDKHEPDYKNITPAWRGGQHEDACRHAAKVVVRRWRVMLDQRQAA